MTSEPEQNTIQEEIECISISKFLETCPPNTLAHLSDLGHRKPYLNAAIREYMLSTPEIQLHCPSDFCNGVRFFRCDTPHPRSLNTEFDYIYITYCCSNCQKHLKIYSLAIKLDSKNSETGKIYKFGEFPTFGPPTPPKLVKLIGQDKDTFLKGRRCENQGLGIGAFIYYRRVVENQKNRILNEIIKVSEKIGAPKEKLDVLREAVSETQFKKALEMAKDAIPESLLINGHSPVLLLHSALSEGVHTSNDEKCLDLASSIRVVLGELSERLGQALKDEAELSKALSTLMHRKKG